MLPVITVDDLLEDVSENGFRHDRLHRSPEPPGDDMPATTPRPWTVTTPVTLEKLEPNLWCIDSPVPGIPGLNRRMSIVKLSDGRLVFHNAVPMDEAQEKEVTAWGIPAFLVVPHGAHKTDAHAFAKRFELKVICPAAAKRKVSTVVEVDGHFDLLPKDSALEASPLDGVKNGEHVLVAHHAGKGASAIVCDAIGNVRHGSGLRGLMFRLLGFTGPEPKVLPVWKLRALADPKALRHCLEKIAATPQLLRLVPSHGGIVTDDPAGAIRRAVATL